MSIDALRFFGTYPVARKPDPIPWWARAGVAAITGWVLWRAVCAPRPDFASYFHDRTTQRFLADYAQVSYGWERYAEHLWVRRQPPQPTLPLFDSGNAFDTQEIEAMR